MGDLDKTINFLKSLLDGANETMRQSIQENINQLEDTKIMIRNLTNKVNQSLMISQNDVLTKIKEL
jgi:hypothetical protein